MDYPTALATTFASSLVMGQIIKLVSRALKRVYKRKEERFMS